MNNNNNDGGGATLIAHAGAKKVTREELMELPIPEATRTHKPVAHFKIVETLEEALSFRHLKIVRDEYAVSNDGMKMFGVMDLNSKFSGGRFSIGLRNSNDKSMRLAMTAGFRVFVCDNLAFNGDFNPLSHKHTRNLQLIDSISIAVDRIQRSFLPMEKQVEEMKTLGLNDAVAKLIIYQAFIDRQIKGIPKHLMSVVHKHYFEPQYEEFEARNLWSLSNAFTSAFKKLNPIKQFKITAKLGTFISDVQDDLSQEMDIKLKAKSNANGNGKGVSANKSNVLTMPDQVPNTSNGSIKGLPNSKDFGYEDLDVDDIPEDAEEEFDDYFDSEEEDEHIEELIERLEREEAKELQKAARIFNNSNLQDF